ncbi:MAG: 5-oxoprolinase [bacterium]|nr:5-oxoprolinase [Deltaproteobacteria bacterium]MCP4905805.1 5-oxoprolinase [bacterium]
MTVAAWQFWIDRGGTFTDCLGIDPDGNVHITKILSSDRAPVEAIEEILARAGAGDVTEVEARVKLGTTVATNALLERRGVATALLTNEGLSGVFDIGTQERPELFALEIERAPRLQRWRLEAPGRRDPEGGVVEALDLDTTRRLLARAKAEGARSLAIAWIHAHATPDDERVLAEVAREIGFAHVVASHEMAREIGLLSRGETAIADAYLTPLLQRHVEALSRGLPGAELRYMQSSGGLTEAERFRGPNALLSGPAGGVVAARRVAREAGYARAIGFDMGGTSTDVSLIEGERLDRAFESEVGGVRVKAPMLRIHTVAAGGGSLCRFDGIRLTVGPESAGSDPGPLCYDQRDANEQPKARELSVTDLNLALGRVVPDRFPFALAREPVDRALAEMRAALSEAGFERSEDEIAAGFFEIANASMAQAIIEVSVERGADPRDHVLVGFGGAGGQHVCAIATRLGIREILLHPYAGLLSAYGIGIAPASWDGQRDGLARRLPRAGPLPESAEREWEELEEEGRRALSEEGGSGARRSSRQGPLEIERSLDLGYRGTDTALIVPCPDAASLSDDAGAAWSAAFEREHRARFGYVREEREIEIKTLRLRVSADGGEAFEIAGLPAGKDLPARPMRTEMAWFPGLGRVEAPVHAREALCVGDRISGPALILEATGTVVVDPGFELEVDRRGVFRLRTNGGATARAAVDLNEADPVRLEVLGNRFMSIAEQMGAVLRNTSVSINIKERLDYSCAVFDQDGGLVANAPHIPVHLGAMADTVAALRERFEPFSAGDVFVTNDPFAGGSHLPDITVVTPVFLADAASPSFFVASRGHHADIGGKTPGSMPADSTRLEEEGVLIEAFALVHGGRFDEARIRRVLGSGRFPARRPDDNVADLEAMVAANRAGGSLLETLVAETGEEVVHVTMVQLQRAAAAKVARELARMEIGEHRFEDALDEGTPICVRLQIDHPAAAERDEGEGTALPASMTIDFAGTGPAASGNLNAPSAVVRAAVLYVLRSLVEERIPLNGGCLDPVEVLIPVDSILDPPRGSAVVGGNVETSQRVVDVLLGALGRAAASQGTMNNVTFGDRSFGYYETIGGGVGATAKSAGASGVHTHMTNTRITDPEILEARYPVRLLRFGLREGSGGAGFRAGGDGIVRRYRFLRPVTVSLLTERRKRAPFGLAGGGPGEPGQNRILRHATGELEEVPGRAELHLEAGDELWIDTPGGGGFGREPSGPTQGRPSS